MRVTPLDIRRQKFRKGMRGYDSGEVDAFLEMLADAWEDVAENTLIEAKELEVLRARASDFDRMEGAVREVLVAQQRSADVAREEANREADLIIRDAELKSQKMLDEARKRVQILTEAIRELQDRRMEILLKMNSFIDSQKGMVAMEEIRIKSEIIPAEERLPGEEDGDMPLLQLSEL
ncbi:MAG: DivIVA domain-containing protein [Candidatus Sabulitectum sp.]|nr:DivIVA domain-containing protein [Candidatus Sabulitectum sp.]MCK5841942.1 DivIVA domain-containing protein [Candidatus Sabulitectum sp.]